MKFEPVNEGSYCGMGKWVINSDETTVGDGQVTLVQKRGDHMMDCCPEGSDKEENIDTSKCWSYDQDWE